MGGRRLGSRLTPGALAQEHSSSGLLSRSLGRGLIKVPVRSLELDCQPAAGPQGELPAHYLQLDRKEHGPPCTACAMTLSLGL